MPTAFESLDRLLAESDADSMDWSDGLGHETANELLAKFGEADWASLKDQHQMRHAKWRECLASVLRPQYGPTAAQLLLGLASDAEPDVAFQALHCIAFYCGVNASAKGPFLDRGIQVPSFVAAARNAPDLLSAIERSRVQSAEHFRARFKLLVEVIQS